MAAADVAVGEKRPLDPGLGFPAALADPHASAVAAKRPRYVKTETQKAAADFFKKLSRAADYARPQRTEFEQSDTFCEWLSEFLRGSIVCGCANSMERGVRIKRCKSKLDKNTGQVGAFAYGFRCTCPDEQWVPDDPATGREGYSTAPCEQPGEKAPVTWSEMMWETGAWLGGHLTIAGLHWIGDRDKYVGQNGYDTGRPLKGGRNVAGLRVALPRPDNFSYDEAPAQAQILMKRYLGIEEGTPEWEATKFNTLLEFSMVVAKRTKIIGNDDPIADNIPGFSKTE